MGLLTQVLLLPLAPVRGTVWVAGKVADAADEELHGPDAVRARLAALNQALEAGEIEPEEFEREEERLLDLLDGTGPADTRTAGTGPDGAGPEGLSPDDPGSDDPAPDDPGELDGPGRRSATDTNGTRGAHP